MIYDQNAIVYDDDGMPWLSDKDVRQLEIEKQTQEFAIKMQDPEFAEEQADRHRWLSAWFGCDMEDMPNGY